MPEIKVPTPLPERDDLPKEVVDLFDPWHKVVAAKELVKTLRQHNAISQNEEYLLLEALRGPILPSYEDPEPPKRSSVRPPLSPLSLPLSDDRYRGYVSTTTTGGFTPFTRTTTHEQFN